MAEYEVELQLERTSRNKVTRWRAMMGLGRHIRFAPHCRGARDVGARAEGTRARGSPALNNSRHRTRCLRLRLGVPVPLAHPAATALR